MYKFFKVDNYLDYSKSLRILDKFRFFWNSGHKLTNEFGQRYFNHGSRYIGFDSEQKSVCTFADKDIERFKYDPDFVLIPYRQFLEKFKLEELE